MTTATNEAVVDVETAMSIRQAAQRLEMSDTTVRNYVESGKLIAVRTALGWLIDAGDVERMAASRVPWPGGFRRRGAHRG